MVIKRIDLVILDFIDLEPCLNMRVRPGVRLHIGKNIE